MALIFQYGSNTYTKRLISPERLGGTATSPGLAYTQERFELAFTYYSGTNQCGTADLLSNGSRQIYGVLYDIPDNRVYRDSGSEHITLDKIEGEGSAYQRIPITVVLADKPNETFEAITYIVKERFSNVQTQTNYVSHIISGLREHSAPDEYISYVKARAIKSNPALVKELNAL